jgi:radical SAM protein with 4Fe4S-binding SPASM domain
VTIARDNGDVVFECDQCGEILEGITSDFNAAWNRAKREGWKAVKQSDAWEHSCPKCSYRPT